MADYTWPFAAGDARFAPEAFDEALEFNVELSVARSGKVSTLALPGARFRCNMQFPEDGVQYLQQRRQLLAFFASLRGGADRLLLWNLHTPQPLGNMRQAPVLASTVTAGASTATISGARAGNNLLRSVESMSTYLGTGWTLTNATLTANTAADPAGGNTASVLTRTATGNHFGYISHTFATTALRTISAVVWLKAGTLAGNVVLRLRDGAGVADRATVTVTPTSTWAYYVVSATFPAGTAADVQCYVDPANDAGSAGDTLLVWFADIRVLSAQDANCTTWAEQLAPPTGQDGMGMEVRRTAAGNANTAWVQTTTAHAGKTYTFSVWLRAGTFSGAVSLFLNDGSGGNVGTLSIPSLPGAWTRYSVTGTFGAAPAANIVGFVDPADGGSIGETYGVYGAMLEEGATPTAYAASPTLLRGDFVAFGVMGQRVMLTADTTFDLAGNGTITFQPAHRTGASAAGAVTVVRPTTKYVLASPVLQMPVRGDRLPGFAVELVEE